jgi:hydrogenase-4 component F
MFFGAGNMMHSLGTKEIDEIRGVARLFPTQGALWIAGAVAITGAPPFGLFPSEFAIMRAGMQPAFSWAVFVMAVLLIVIFVGFLNHFREMYFQPSTPTDNLAPALSRWCVAPMWFALAPLLLFGLWWPSGMWDHFSAIAHVLTSAAP